MPTKRFKIFQKIAQDATIDTTSGTNTTATPSTTVAGAPSTITVDMFPTFTQAWGSNFKTPVNELLDTLNWAIFILTLGEHDFFKLKNSDFTIDSTKYDSFTNTVIYLAKTVFYVILNKGAAFTAQVADKKTPISYVYKIISTNSAIPDSLNNTFPQSFLQTKVGNFKTKIINILSIMNSIS